MTWSVNRDSRQAAEIARAWLSEMEQCVQTVDYGRCRGIFAADVVGFGTKASIAEGIDSLENDQWRHIWGNIRGFTFLVDDLHCGLLGDGALWIACPWTSEGKGQDGQWQQRPGRMTAVLQRRNNDWLAVHTHHSLAPVPAT